MKIGVRKRSFKKTLKAKTTGKVKRSLKKSVNPLYGKKGMGFVKSPTKSVKSAIYHKTTVGIPYSGLSSSRKTQKLAQPVEQRQGHSIILWILFGGIVVWIPAIYYTISPNHNWHI